MVDFNKLLRSLPIPAIVSLITSLITVLMGYATAHPGNAEIINLLIFLCTYAETYLQKIEAGTPGTVNITAPTVTLFPPTTQQTPVTSPTTSQTTTSTASSDGKLVVNYLSPFSQTSGNTITVKCTGFTPNGNGDLFASGSDIGLSGLAFDGTGAATVTLTYMENHDVASALANAIDDLNGSKTLSLEAYDYTSQAYSQSVPVVLA